MSRIFGPQRPTGPQWQPKFPGFSRPPNKGSQREGELSPLSASGDILWVPAPPTSHLEGFRLYDADDEKIGGFIRKFLGGESSIQIRFKPSGKQTSATEYHYYFSDAKEARGVFQQLVEAEHPGEIVHHVLIAQGVRYKRQS
jgi:hypothetical protein